MSVSCRDIHQLSDHFTHFTGFFIKGAVQRFSELLLFCSADEEMGSFISVDQTAHPSLAKRVAVASVVFSPLMLTKSYNLHILLHSLLCCNAT